MIDQADGAEIHALVSLQAISVVVVGVASTKIMLAVIQLVILGGSAIRAEVHLRCGAGHAQDKIVTVMPPAVLADDVSPAVLAGFGFTQREAALLVHLREGRQNKVIAHRLDISESTVKVHLRNIMRKLHASNRTQVVNILAAIQQSAPAASDMIAMADGAGSAEAKQL
ncbi:MAG: response regulator transcription factor [Proteobacteria bacterium]|nr:response regulator transcription factor [Pseudomonadota bacterium]